MSIVKKIASKLGFVPEYKLFEQQRDSNYLINKMVDTLVQIQDDPANASTYISKLTHREYTPIPPGCRANTWALWGNEVSVWYTSEHIILSQKREDLLKLIKSPIMVKKV